MNAFLYDNDVRDDTSPACMTIEEHSPSEPIGSSSYSTYTPQWEKFNKIYSSMKANSNNVDCKDTVKNNPYYRQYSNVR